MVVASCDPISFVEGARDMWDRSGSKEDGILSEHPRPSSIGIVTSSVAIEAGDLLPHSKLYWPLLVVEEGSPAPLKTTVSCHFVCRRKSQLVATRAVQLQVPCNYHGDSSPPHIDSPCDSSAGRGCSPDAVARQGSPALRRVLIIPLGLDPIHPHEIAGSASG